MPVAGSDKKKKTNEIGMCIPMLKGIEIAGKDITADALLTQRKIAAYIVERKAHYHFTVKDNQRKLKDAISLLFKDCGSSDYEQASPKAEHGRIETRRIWVASASDKQFKFAHAAQVFMIEREVVFKKSGECTHEIVVGITSRSSKDCDAKRLLEINRGHWTIENKCHYVLDWSYDEDRSRIRSKFGPENITRLRRFAIGVIAIVTRGKASVSEKMQQLSRNVRLVFDYLRMTRNTIKI